MHRIDRVKHGADLALAGDSAHGEQGLAVRRTLAGFQVPLVRQERGALQEEGGKGDERKISHGTACILAAPVIRPGFATAAQGGEEAVLGLHPHLESDFDSGANPENGPAPQSAGQRDSSDLLQRRSKPQPRRHQINRSQPPAKMRTAGDLPPASGETKLHAETQAGAARHTDAMLGHIRNVARSLAGSVSAQRIAKKGFVAAGLSVIAGNTMMEAVHFIHCDICPVFIGPSEMVL